jgi:hypothetical protein
MAHSVCRFRFQLVPKLRLGTLLSKLHFTSDQRAIPVSARTSMGAVSIHLLVATREAELPRERSQAELGNEPPVVMATAHL